MFYISGGLTLYATSDLQLGHSYMDTLILYDFDINGNIYQPAKNLFFCRVSKIGNVWNEDPLDGDCGTLW